MMAKIRPAPQPGPRTNYQEDYYAWTQRQVELLRAKRFSELDLAHLTEELEDLGRSEKRSLTSHLRVLLGHLLTWHYQPDYPYQKSGRATIKEQRRQIQKLLSENPSLKLQLVDLIVDAYQSELNLAVSETPLDYDAFPGTCPWTAEQILGNPWPE